MNKLTKNESTAQASNTFVISQACQKLSGDVILGNSSRYCSVYKLQYKTIRIDENYTDF